jgi:hypothetical protein
MVSAKLVFSALIDAEQGSDKLSPLSTVTLQKTRETVIIKRKLESPSQQAHPKAFEALQKNDETFFGCNRPPGREPNLPLALLHPVFGRFIDNTKRIVPKTKTMQWPRI